MIYRQSYRLNEKLLYSQLIYRIKHHFSLKTNFVLRVFTVPMAEPTDGTA